MAWQSAMFLMYCSVWLLTGGFPAVKPGAGGAWHPPRVALGAHDRAVRLLQTMLMRVVQHRQQGVMGWCS